jgi:hypothetical protein
MLVTCISGKIQQSINLLYITKEQLATAMTAEHMWSVQDV